MNTEGPVRENASPGRIKIPELIIAPVAIQKTSRKVNPFFNSILFSPDHLLLLLRDLWLTWIDIEFGLHMNTRKPFMESVLGSETSSYLNLH